MLDINLKKYVFFLLQEYSNRNSDSLEIAKDKFIVPNNLFSLQNTLHTLFHLEFIKLKSIQKIFLCELPLDRVHPQ